MQIGKKYKVKYFGKWTEAILVEGSGTDPMWDIEGEASLTSMDVIDEVGSRVVKDENPAPKPPPIK